MERCLLSLSRRFLCFIGTPKKTQVLSFALSSSFHASQQHSTRRRAHTLSHQAACSLSCALARALLYLKSLEAKEGERHCRSMAASTAARRSSRRRRRCSSPSLLALLPLAVVALASAGALAQVGLVLRVRI
jgi:hypothetical protein